MDGTVSGDGAGPTVFRAVGELVSEPGSGRPGNLLRPEVPGHRNDRQPAAGDGGAGCGGDGPGHRHRRRVGHPGRPQRELALGQLFYGSRPRRQRDARLLACIDDDLYVLADAALVADGGGG